MGRSEGISAIEYSLLASLVAMVILVTVIVLSGQISGLYIRLVQALP